MPPTKYGYARVSTNEQNPEMQVLALREAGCDRRNVFVDHGISGKFSRRPELDRCLARLQPGDTLMVWKLDRLGRSTADLLKLVADLKKESINFLSLTERQIDTGSPHGQLVFEIFAALSQYERGLLLERTSEGRVRHKKRLEDKDPKAKPFGAPPRLDKTQKMGLASMYKSGKTINFIAENYRVSRATVYRALREMLPSRFPRSKKRTSPAKATSTSDKSLPMISSLYFDPTSDVMVSPEVDLLIAATDPITIAALEKQIGMTQFEATLRMGSTFDPRYIVKDVRKKRSVLPD